MSASYLIPLKCSSFATSETRKKSHFEGARGIVFDDNIAFRLLFLSAVACGSISGDFVSVPSNGHRCHCETELFKVSPRLQKTN